MINNRWENGIMVYGVPVGSDTYVRHMLQLKVEEVAKRALRAKQVLHCEKMALWQVLKQSISQQLDWWLTLVYPSLVLEAAQEVDKIIWSVLETAAGSSIPRGNQGMGWDCPLEAPVEPWQGQSYQEMKVHLPSSMGGLGLASMVELSPAAFIGGLQQSLPHFIGQNLCPQLKKSIGGPSGELQPKESMWLPLLQSNCRTGRELAAAWTMLQSTGQQACEYLGRDLQGALASPVEGMGDGAMDGSVRRAVVQQLHGLRKAVLEKALNEYSDQSARPVLHNPQLDKISSAWVTALPSPESYIPSPAFAEGMCGYLCVPSPACRDLIGQKIGKETVDIWGDRVQSQTLVGDIYRHKHDSVKMKIFSLANECHLPATCEVFGIFAPCIPQRGLSRMERGRARQSIIPDFLFQLPHTIGGDPLDGGSSGGTIAAGKLPTLGELKTVSFCPTYFFPGAKKRGVELRADKIPSQYTKKARDTDRDFCNTPQGTIGPVETKLNSFPPLLKLVVGPNAECSSDLHDLVQILAESRARHLSRTQGKEVTSESISNQISYIRRQISVRAVRANADSLFTRLLQVDQGLGAQAAARRRGQAIEREERGRRDRAAHWLQHRTGNRIIRRGQFLVE